MTTFEYSPSLTEPGVKFFLGETLKTSRNKKDIFNNKIIYKYYHFDEFSE